MKLNPVMMPYLRISKLSKDKKICMALFFMKDSSSSDIHELIIDTRLVYYCDFVDYIVPELTKELLVDDLIERQNVFWHFYSKLTPYKLDLIKFHESTNNKYKLCIQHGLSVNIDSVSYDKETYMEFNITQYLNKIVAAVAYHVEYEIPNTIKDIVINSNTIE